MTSNNKNRFFLKHSKSSAVLVSIGIHAALVLISLSFVAVIVVQKEEKKFEAVPVYRPQLQLKKLQVPVNITKKKVQKPKLRKRIVVPPKMNRSMSDIKMPEISGIKGGQGNDVMGGLSGMNGIGFSMPEIDLFGIKSKGEKVFVILDASPEMMYDEIGGIPAYTIIKDELIKIVGSLPSTTLFNISVYDSDRTFVLFPSLVSANSENVTKAALWLKTLNAASPDMGANEWGGSTLGTDGTEVQENFLFGTFQHNELWHRPAMLAMKQQADSVYLLTSFWGNQRIAKEINNNDWFNSSAGRRWQESYETAKRLLDEENRKRGDAGKPPRVIRRDNSWEMNAAYFPDIERPPEPEYYYHAPSEYLEGFLAIREKFKPNVIQSGRGTGRRKSELATNFSFNTIYFKKLDAEENYWRDGRSEENFAKLTRLCEGKFQTIEGLEAIKSSIK